MLTEGLFNEALIQPITEFSLDSLYIVSGYASPSMVERHFQELEKLDLQIGVCLIVGMVRNDGINEGKHQSFLKATESYNFDCRYIVEGNPVHAKVYLWQKEEEPVLAYTGSANYTLTGFGGDQQEVLSQCDAISAKRFYEMISQQTVSCTERNIEQRINLLENRVRRQLPGLSVVELSLLDSRTGETHKKAGLNWGQRAGRNPNQAYIPIPSSIYRGDFFPPIGRRFNVLTDDGETFIFVRAQERGKALHTSVDNGLMGLYFRTRIGVGSGEFVRTEDLSRYGRTTVQILKVDDENYFLDFSVDRQPE